MKPEKWWQSPNWDTFWLYCILALTLAILAAAAFVFIKDAEAWVCGDPGVNPNYCITPTPSQTPTVTPTGTPTPTEAVCTHEASRTPVRRRTATPTASPSPTAFITPATTPTNASATPRATETPHGSIRGPETGNGGFVCGQVD